MHSITLQWRRRPTGIGKNRGISLQSVAGEMYGKRFIDRVVESTEVEIVGEQYGFRKAESYANDIFMEKKYCEKMKDNKKVAVLLFMDLQRG